MRGLNPRTAASTGLPGHPPGMVARAGLAGRTKGAGDSPDVRCRAVDALSYVGVTLAEQEQSYR